MRNKLLIICLLVAANLSAQESFEEYRNRLKKDFTEFKSNVKEDYDKFRQQIMKDYCDMLKKAWDDMKAFQGKPMPEEKRVPPVVIPKEERKEPVFEKPRPIELVIRPQQPKTRPVPLIEPKPLVKLPSPYSFKFFGTDFDVDVKKESLPFLNGNDRDAVSDYWEKISDRKYDGIVETCIKARKNKGLCDWAYLLMLRDMANSVYNGKPNEAALLMAYIYSRSGYQMRLAFTDTGNICILYSSEHTIYNKSYWKVDGVKYYAMDYDGDNIKFCNASFPQEKPLSLIIDEQPQLSVSSTNKRTLAARDYNVKAEVYSNDNIIKFFDTYPASCINDDFATKWIMYANTPIDKATSESLYPALRQSIQGCSKKEAAERLLNFVQTAFEYEYDDKVWGYDRAFFAEETLYYPYCDCEDRSILFSHLVRDLLGLKAVLIYYPGHLATAVNFENSVNGDYVMVDNVKYTICDPTYIGAPIGMTMPGMDNSKCKVIMLQ